MSLETLKVMVLFLACSLALSLGQRPCHLLDCPFSLAGLALALVSFLCPGCHQTPFLNLLFPQLVKPFLMELSSLAHMLPAGRHPPPITPALTHHSAHVLHSFPSSVRPPGACLWFVMGPLPSRWSPGSWKAVTLFTTVTDPLALVNSAQNREGVNKCQSHQMALKSERKMRHVDPSKRPRKRKSQQGN